MSTSGAAHLRAQLSGGVQRVADIDGLRSLDRLSHKFVVDVLKHQQVGRISLTRIILGDYR